jgi:hypothetical protein
MNDHSYRRYVVSPSVANAILLGPSDNSVELGPPPQQPISVRLLKRYPISWNLKQINTVHILFYVTALHVGPPGDLFPSGFPNKISINISHFVCDTPPRNLPNLISLA